MSLSYQQLTYSLYPLSFLAIKKIRYPTLDFDFRIFPIAIFLLIQSLRIALFFWFIGYILKYPGCVPGFSLIIQSYLDLSSSPASSSFLKSLAYLRNSFGISLSRSSPISRGSIPIPSLGAAYPRRALTLKILQIPTLVLATFIISQEYKA